MNRNSPAARFNASERGVVLIWTMLSMMLVAGLIMSGSSEFEALDEVGVAEFAAGGQAGAVAEAGVVDAYAWFRRQTTQPVASFTPQLDLDADPEVNETEDPSVGLVRTFEVAPGLWARYSVARGEVAESFTDTNSNGVFDEGEPFTDTNGDGKRTPGEGTRDVSSERGLPGVGTVWLIESEARVFRRSNLSLPLGQGPNVQVAHARVATEIRRLAIIPPSAAALCCKRGDAVNVGSRGRIRADTAIAYDSGTGSPDTSGGEVPGARTAVPGYKDYVEDVFGVDWTMLRSMADISTMDPVNGVPAPIPDFSLVVITGDVTFDLERPLRGTAIVVVKGNCTIESGSNSFFNGLLYVDGDLTARAPTYLRGTVVVTGDADIRGTGGDYCELEYDENTLQLLQVKMGQYRYTKSRYIPAPKMEDGRADEGLTITAPLDPIGGGGDDAPPSDTFQTDELNTAIDDYLAQYDGPGSMKLQQAQLKLEQARAFLMQDPPKYAQALQKVGQATQNLDQADGMGADIAGLFDHLWGGEGKLFDGMFAMVDRMITESTADPADIAAAQAEFNAASAERTNAQAEHAGGQFGNAASKLHHAADKLKTALDRLE